LPPRTVTKLYKTFLATYPPTGGEIRIVCLKRPRDEVVAGFCRLLDQSPYPINVRRNPKTPFPQNLGSREMPLVG